MLDPSRWLSSLLGLVLLLGAYAAAFSQETGFCSVTGTVTGGGSTLGAGLEVVLSPEAPDSPLPTVRTRTRPDGRFRFPRVAEGIYTLEARTEYHQGSRGKVSVKEGSPTVQDVALQPVEPFLRLHVHRHCVYPGNVPAVAVDAFRQGDSVELQLDRIDPESLTENESRRTLAQLLSWFGEPIRSGPEVPAGLRLLPAGIRRTLSLKKDREGRSYHKESLPPDLQRGIYLVRVRGKSGLVRSWLSITSVGVISKAAGGKLVVFAADLRSGVAVSDASVRFRSPGGKELRGTTDRSGLVTLNVPPPDDRSQEDGTLVVRRGDELAVDRRSSSSWDDGEKYTVHVVTDRPVYRPGHRVQFKGIIREDSGADYRSARTRSVEVEILDPSEAEIARLRLPVTGAGSYSGSVELPNSAAGGSYSIKTHLGAEEHWNSFSVASYRKPEWTVAVTPEKSRYVRGDTVSARIQATYFYGAPVGEGRVTYFVFRSPRWNWWDDSAFEGCECGGLPSEENSGEYVSDGEAALDPSGQAVIRFPVSELPPTSDGVTEWDFRIEATVADPSERTASGSTTVRVAASEIGLDVRFERDVAVPGKPVTAEIRARGQNDEPVANLPLTIALEQRSSGRTQTADGAVPSVGTTDAKGYHQFNFTPSASGMVTVRVTAKDPRGLAAVGRRELWVVDPSEQNPEFEVDYPNLAVVTDRKHYQVGESAEVLINTDQPGGHALVTLQSNRLHSARALRLQGRSTRIRMPITPDLAPNVYLSVALIRKGEMVTTEKLLEVDPSDHRIQVEITSERETYRPRDLVRYTITTRDKAGKPVPAEVAFGVVDEAIYSVKADDPLALWNAFYPRRSNSVSTSFSNPPAYLGDADKSGPGIKVRREFPDTAFWDPAVQTGPDGTAKVEVRLKDSLTSWRATASAVTDDTRIGRAQQLIRVQQELVIRLQTPRAALEGDRIEVTAVVQNLSGVPQTAELRLSGSGVADPRVDGEATRSVTLAHEESKRVEWPVVINRSGNAVFTVTGRAGPFSDGMELTVPVGRFARERVASFAGEAGTSPFVQSIRVEPDTADGELELRFSPTVAGGLLGSLEYLATYPYGCTEQTMSSFLPDVVVLNTLDKLGLASTDRNSRVRAMAREGLFRLYRYQHADGGWGWWEYDETDRWMTAYVLFGLAQARKAGVTVSERVFRSGLEAAGGMVAPPDSAAHRTHSEAFLAFALAEAGAKDQAQKLLAELKPTLPTNTRYDLACAVLAAQKLGMQRQSRQWMNELWKLAGTREQSDVHWEEPDRNNRWWVPMDVETTAMGLLAAVRVDPEDERIPSITRWLMARRRGNSWASTRDTAWVLLALSEYLTAHRDHQPDLQYRAVVNGRVVHTGEFQAEDLARPEVVVRIPATELRGENQLEVNVTGKGRVFVAGRIRRAIPAVRMEAESGLTGLSVRREYFLLRRAAEKGPVRRIPTGARPEQAFQVGDSVMVRTTVETPREMEYVMLRIPHASGFEVLDRGDVTRDDWSYWWSNMDVRDDQVTYFFRTLPKGVSTIEYHLRPEIPSNVRVLPASLEDMYDPDLRAESTDARLQVRR